MSLRMASAANEPSIQARENIGARLKATWQNFIGPGISYCANVGTEYSDKLFDLIAVFRTPIAGLEGLYVEQNLDESVWDP